MNQDYSHEEIARAYAFYAWLDMPFAAALRDPQRLALLRRRADDYRAQQHAKTKITRTRIETPKQPKPQWLDGKSLSAGEGLQSLCAT
jgi:hypothetical protein